MILHLANTPEWLLVMMSNKSVWVRVGGVGSGSNFATVLAGDQLRREKEGWRDCRWRKTAVLMLILSSLLLLSPSVSVPLLAGGTGSLMKRTDGEQSTLSAVDGVQQAKLVSSSGIGCRRIHHVKASLWCKCVVGARWADTSSALLLSWWGWCRLSWSHTDSGNEKQRSKDWHLTVISAERVWWGSSVTKMTVWKC